MTSSLHDPPPYTPLDRSIDTDSIMQRTSDDTLRIKTEIVDDSESDELSVSKNATHTTATELVSSPKASSPIAQHARNNKRPRDDTPSQDELSDEELSTTQQTISIPTESELRTTWDIMERTTSDRRTKKRPSIVEDSSDDDNETPTASTSVMHPLIHPLPWKKVKAVTVREVVGSMLGIGFVGSRERGIQRLNTIQTHGVDKAKEDERIYKRDNPSVPRNEKVVDEQSSEIRHSRRKPAPRKHHALMAQSSSSRRRHSSHSVPSIYPPTISPTQSDNESISTGYAPSTRNVNRSQRLSIANNAVVGATDNSTSSTRTPNVYDVIMALLPQVVSFPPDSEQFNEIALFILSDETRKDKDFIDAMHAAPPAIRAGILRDMLVTHKKIT